MAKIEKPSALKYINEICQIADGIMIARGDLGVELPIETVPGWQKKIIRISRDKWKACSGFNTNARVNDLIIDANKSRSF